jgi:ribosome-binding ATPase YchF (GTP1/OBG family)
VELIMNELETLRKQVKQLKKINDTQDKAIKELMKDLSKAKQEVNKRSQWVEYEKDI